jgi:nitroreductase
LELSEAIRNRTSIRKYLPRPVESEKIVACIDAARLAPSACNAQPWRFIAVDDPDLLRDLAPAFGGIYGISRFARKAPVLIAIISDPDWLPSAGGKLRKTDFHLIDIGIAGEHFVLKAVELGLGTCWIGWFDENRVKKVLKIPVGKRVEIMLSLGYPALEQGPPHKRKPLEDIYTQNGWRD